MGQAGVEFSVIPVDVDEAPILNENPKDHVLRMAQEKAEKSSNQHPLAWVLAADTIVVIDNEILGKPTNREDARRMLYKLSGKQHQVMTAYCLKHQEKKINELQWRITDVEFHTLSYEEIEDYLDSGEPFDKAGAYGIQGLGAKLVKRFDGSYSNVIGLPLAAVINLFKRFGLIS